VTEIWTKLQRAGRDLLRRDTSASERIVRLGQRLVNAGRLEPRISVRRNVVVELNTPPKEIRALRDLVVRRGGAEDIESLATLDGTEREAVRARLTRGDRAYVGLVGDKVVCKTWFHGGPTPFDEDRDAIVSWALEPSDFWSYNGAAAADAMATGFFIKMFVAGIRDLFEGAGAKHVRGYIRDNNGPSLALHDRLGFTRVGILITVNLPGVKWVHWDGRGGPRQWLVRRAASLTFPFPS